MKLIRGEPSAPPTSRRASWSGYSGGDYVKIQGERGTFKVLHFDVFPEPRRAEVTCIGEGRFRTFIADRITRKVKVP